MQAAHDYLTAQREAADGSPDYQWLSDLEDVADNLRRVLRPDATPNYRADKGSDLAVAARRGLAVALTRYADSLAPDEGEADRRADLIATAGRELDAIDAECVGFMWLAARGEPLTRRQVEGLRVAVRGLARWADRLAVTAVEDDDG